MKKDVDQQRLKFAGKWKLHFRDLRRISVRRSEIAVAREIRLEAKKVLPFPSRLMQGRRARACISWPFLLWYYFVVLETHF